MDMYGVKKGKRFIITGLELSKELKDRLFYLGIFLGEKGVTVEKAPFSGPIMIKVNGVTVGIRKSVAKKITVREIV